MFSTVVGTEIKPEVRSSLTSDYSQTLNWPRCEKCWYLLMNWQPEQTRKTSQNIMDGSHIVISVAGHKFSSCSEAVERGCVSVAPPAFYTAPDEVTSAPASDLAWHLERNGLLSTDLLFRAESQTTCVQLWDFERSVFAQTLWEFILSTSTYIFF